MPGRTEDATNDWGVIVDNLHESVIATDTEGYITYWNKGAERLFGYTAKEALGRNIAICYERHREALEREILAPLRREGHLEVFGKMVHKSGETFDGHMLLSLITSPDGIVIGLIGYTLDITRRKQAEAALFESERNLRNITNLTPVGIYRADPEGHLTYANDRWRKIMDLPGDAALGEGWISSVHPVDRDPLIEAWQNFINGQGEKFETHSRIIRPDGSIVWLTSQAYRDYGPSGELLGYVGSITDITEIKEAQSALEQSENSLQIMTRLSPVGIFRTDLEGRIIQTNETWKQISGLGGGDRGMGDGWALSLHPDDRNRVLAEWAAAVADDADYAGEFRMVTPEGQERWVYSQATPERDETGRRVGYVGTVTDITERKRTERALAESENRVRRAFENVTVGNIVISPKGIIDTFNAAAEKIFGYTAEEVIGRNVKMLMPEADRHEHDGHIQNYLKTGGKKVIGIGREVTGLRKNGEEFPMHLGVGEMIIGGEVSFVGSITDLSNTKHLEEQLRRSQRLETVGQLTGGIAHDFNNLLAIIIGNAELIVAMINEDGELKRRAKAIQAAADRGSSLTQRLLAFSRQQTLSPVAADIADLTSGLEDMLRRTLGETIDLSIESVSELWSAMIDLHQLENALINLAVNARDAMPTGGTLTIDAANVTLDEAFAAHHEGVVQGDYVKVAVTDTGFGMPPEVLEKVFEPFYTTKEVGKGSGLGLSMVYGFVKQSEGYITIDSEVDRGTTVNLYLPRSKKAVTQDKVEESSAKTSRGSERILIVEDNEGVRDVAVSILQDQGYEVAEAKDGDEAVARLTEGKAFDLLFTDVVLPGGMSGVEIAEQAERLQPTIKVLFTTGYAENAIAHSGHLNPGVMLVNKPYRRADLLEKVRAMLESETA